MRLSRAAVAAIVTAFGVGWLLELRPLPHPAVVASAPVPDAVATPVPAATPGVAPSPSSSTASGPSGTFIGSTVYTRFGPVQVEVIVASGKVADVKALQLPSDRQRSAQISQYASPALRQEAIAAQSAQIDNVSGATYTSAGYAQSLQSALAKAGLK